MIEQPEALRLADKLESCYGTDESELEVRAAAELRRLHAQCERMREALEAMLSVNCELDAAIADEKAHAALKEPQ